MRLQRLIAVLAVAAASVAGSGAAGESARVALLPIAVHSAEQETSYLSEGLAAMLAARLEQSGQLVVLRVGGNTAPGTNESAAIELGRRAGASHVVFGSYTQFGQGASLDVRCAAVAAAGDGDEPEEARRVFVQSGTVGDLIPKLDGLADKLMRYLDGTEIAGADPLGAQTPAYGSDDLLDLEQRVEALEREVYSPSLATDPDSASAESNAADPASVLPVEADGGPAAGEGLR